MGSREEEAAAVERKRDAILREGRRREGGGGEGGRSRRWPFEVSFGRKEEKSSRKMKTQIFRSDF